MRNRINNQQRRGARQQSSGFYTGRTTVTSTDRTNLRDRKDYRRKKLSRQKRQESLSKIIAASRWLVAIALIVVVVNQFRLTDYAIESPDRLNDADRAEIASVTDEYVRGLQSLKPFFDSAKLEEHIQKNATFVATTEVSHGVLGSTLSIRVTAKTPMYVFQAIDSPVGSLWLAQDGSVVSLSQDQKQSLSSTLPETIVRDSSNVEYAPGDQFTSVSMVDFLSKTEIALADNKETVESFAFNENPREVQVWLKGKPYYLRLSTDRPIQSMVEDYVAMKQTVDKNGSSINQYVDLRVVDKVFYK